MGGKLPPSLFCLISPHQKIESPCPFPGHRPHIGEKVFLIAFRLILPKILPRARIFTRTIMNYLENLIGTISFNMKQYPAGCLPELHSLYLLSYQKCTKMALHWYCFVAPSRYGLPPTLLPNLFKPKIYSFPATRDKFTSSPKKRESDLMG